jgi:hypothetical protein
MTTHAQDRRVGSLWDQRGRIVGMASERAVAGLARNMGVFARFLQVEHLLMANRTGIVAGKHHGTAGDLGDRIAAIVPVPTKAAGHDHAADHKEQNNANDEKQGHSSQVLGILR